MAYTQAQLEAQLANAQRVTKPGSVTGTATINRIQNELNALKGASTPAANTAQQLGQMVTSSTPKQTGLSGSALGAVGYTPTKPQSIPSNVTPITGTFMDPRAQLRTAPSTPIQDKQPPETMDFSTLYSQLKDLIVPQKQTVPYTSPYATQISNALANWQTKTATPFVYDPNSDAGLKAAQQQAQQQTMREFARKNLLGSMSNEAQAQLAAMNLIPEYQQMAQNQNNNETNNLYKNLELLNSLDTQAYNRYNQGITNDMTTRQNNISNMINTINTGSNLKQQDFNQDVTKAGLTGKFQGSMTTQEQQRIRDNEVSLYGTELNPAARQYLAVNQSMPNNIRQEVLKYSQDYAAEINKRSKDDPLLPYLYAARAQKIVSSPELLQKYGKDIAIGSPVVAKMALEYQSKQIETAINAIKYQYADKQLQAELDKVLAEVKKLDYEAAEKELEASILPDKLKYQLMQEMAKVSLIREQTNSQISGQAVDSARIGLIGEQKNTELTQQAKNLATANNEANKFDYDAFDRIDKYVQGQYMQKNKSTVNEGRNSTNTETMSIIPGKEKELQKYLYSLYADEKFDNKVAKALLATYNIPEPTFTPQQLQGFADYNNSKFNMGK